MGIEFGSMVKKFTLTFVNQNNSPGFFEKKLG